MQKIFMAGLVQGHMVPFAFGVAVCDITLWRHFHVSKPTFWWSLL